MFGCFVSKETTKPTEKKNETATVFIIKRNKLAAKKIEVFDIFEAIERSQGWNFSGMVSFKAGK